MDGDLVNSDGLPDRASGPMPAPGGAAPVPARTAADGDSPALTPGRQRALADLQALFPDVEVQLEPPAFTPGPSTSIFDPSVAQRRADYRQALADGTPLPMAVVPDEPLSSVSAFVAAMPKFAERVGVRSPQERSNLVERVQRDEGGILSADGSQMTEGSEEVLALWDLAVIQARVQAQIYTSLAALWCEGDDEDPDKDANSLAVAQAMRVTDSRSALKARQAHDAVTLFPKSHELLAQGLFPLTWFEKMLADTRSLPPVARQGIDETVAGWDLRITPERFYTRLRMLVAWAQEIADKAAQAEKPDAEALGIQRSVTVTDIGRGHMAMEIIGPASEIAPLAHRLDVSARAVQAAQRAALAEAAAHAAAATAVGGNAAGSDSAAAAEGSIAGPDTGPGGSAGEGEGASEAPKIPWDVDGVVSETGKPLRTGALRYLMLTKTQPDLKGVDIPEDRFRMNVTVPFLTLIDQSDAPGILEGTSPIPADMARALAGNESVWYRILTDPCTGVFLPLPATTYRPTSAMLEHLRMRNSTCAVPGCGKSVTVGAQADHIHEFLDGGPTSIENLHLLCERHHQMKTAGTLDPTRLPAKTTADGSWEPGRTEWLIGPRDGTHVIVETSDDIDLIGKIGSRWLVDHFRNHPGERCTNACIKAARMAPPDGPDEPDRESDETGPPNSGEVSAQQEDSAPQEGSARGEDSAPREDSSSQKDSAPEGNSGSREDSIGRSDSSPAQDSATDETTNRTEPATGKRIVVLPAWALTWPRIWNWHTREGWKLGTVPDTTPLADPTPKPPTCETCGQQKPKTTTAVSEHGKKTKRPRIITARTGTPARTAPTTAPKPSLGRPDYENLPEPPHGWGDDGGFDSLGPPPF